jgi:hypothetical protein
MKAAGAPTIDKERVCGVLGWWIPDINESRDGGLNAP